MDFAFVKLRPAPPVADQPRMTMRDWCLVHTGDFVLLAGMVETSPDALTCRITSPARSVEVEARTVRTSSGRTYELFGAPATGSVLDVVKVRLALAGYTEAVDLSHFLWQEIRRCSH